MAKSANSTTGDHSFVAPPQSPLFRNLQSSSNMVPPNHAHTGSQSAAEIDQLERLAAEIQQLHKQQVFDALAGHGYSQIVSGFCANSRPTLPPIDTNIVAASPAGSQRGRRNTGPVPAVPALPDSPRVDRFAA
ncbi:hypothetical protein FRB99_008896 [Tulasnella sp. 403]|nr:hypothetical protein FRB99_008896 [Tulasnella sp. 403]